MQSFSILTFLVALSASLSAAEVHVLAPAGVDPFEEAARTERDKALGLELDRVLARPDVVVDEVLKYLRHPEVSPELKKQFAAKVQQAQTRSNELAQELLLLSKNPDLDPSARGYLFTAGMNSFLSPEVAAAAYTAYRSLNLTAAGDQSDFIFAARVLKPEVAVEQLLAWHKGRELSVREKNNLLQALIESQAGKLSVPAQELLKTALSDKELTEYTKNKIAERLWKLPANKAPGKAPSDLRDYLEARHSSTTDVELLVPYADAETITKLWLASSNEELRAKGAQAYARRLVQRKIPLHSDARLLSLLEDKSLLVQRVASSELVEDALRQPASRELSDQFLALMGHPQVAVSGRSADYHARRLGSFVERVQEKLDGLPIISDKLTQSAPFSELDGDLRQYRERMQTIQPREELFNALAVLAVREAYPENVQAAFALVALDEKSSGLEKFLAGVLERRAILRDYEKAFPSFIMAYGTVAPATPETFGKLERLFLRMNPQDQGDATIRRAAVQAMTLSGEPGYLHARDLQRRSGNRDFLAPMLPLSLRLKYLPEFMRDGYSLNYSLYFDDWRPSQVSKDEIRIAVAGALNDKKYGLPSLRGESFHSADYLLRQGELRSDELDALVDATVAYADSGSYAMDGWARTINGLGAQKNLTNEHRQKLVDKMKTLKLDSIYLEKIYANIRNLDFPDRSGVKTLIHKPETKVSFLIRPILEDYILNASPHNPREDFAFKNFQELFVKEQDGFYSRLAPDYYQAANYRRFFERIEKNPQLIEALYAEVFAQMNARPAREIATYDLDDLLASVAMFDPDAQRVVRKMEDYAELLRRRSLFSDALWSEFVAEVLQGRASIEEPLLPYASIMSLKGQYGYSFGRLYRKLPPGEARMALLKRQSASGEENALIAIYDGFNGMSDPIAAGEFLVSQLDAPIEAKTKNQLMARAADTTLLAQLRNRSAEEPDAAAALSVVAGKLKELTGDEKHKVAALVMLYDVEPAATARQINALAKANIADPQLHQLVPALASRDFPEEEFFPSLIAYYKQRMRVGPLSPFEERALGSLIGSRRYAAQIWSEDSPMVDYIRDRADSLAGNSINSLSDSLGSISEAARKKINEALKARIETYVARTAENHDWQGPADAYIITLPPERRLAEYQRLVPIIAKRSDSQGMEFLLKSFRAGLDLNNPEHVKSFLELALSPEVSRINQSRIQVKNRESFRFRQMPEEQRAQVRSTLGNNPETLKLFEELCQAEF
jgi:hypothetical protein